MKNKIKKILFLGMTAMFTAGAAGSAVISCPVWADETEDTAEDSETTEDAEDETADQAEDTAETTELKNVEHPRMST